MYLSGVLPWNSRQWVAPPPEEIARIRKEAGTEIDVPQTEADAIQQHISREDAAAMAAAQREKEQELDRSSGEGTETEHHDHRAA
jgi:MFS transporter, SP family, sugar:H+ symporter